jgi:hypothetical protein
MITLIAAAALAAQAPAAAPPPMAGHAQHDPSDNGKDCCKDCCKDMAAKHDGHGTEHAEHSAQ